MFRTARFVRLLRQLLTVVIALALSASVLEAVVPDVHDGDAAATTTALHDGSDSGGEQHRLPHDAPHGVHVEHCGHAHLASLATGPRLDIPRVTPSRAPVIHIARLESIAMPPAFRPPIILS